MAPKEGGKVEARTRDPHGSKHYPVEGRERLKPEWKGDVENEMDSSLKQKQVKGRAEEAPRKCLRHTTAEMTLQRCL